MFEQCLYDVSNGGCTDVVVLGGGPAGLVLATELARAGASVRCVAPTPAAPWTATYGVWLDELEPDLTACIGRSWRHPQAQIDDGRRVPLERGYGVFANDALQSHWTDAFVRHAGRFMAAAAEVVEPRGSQHRVYLSGGGHVDARLVVDASGARSHFVRRPQRRCGFQSAYGETLRVSGHRFARDEMSLMDFRAIGEPTEAATFLYALPRGENVIFAEETSLVAHRPTSHVTLRERLHRRLDRMGLRVVEVLHREVCLIPMGIGIPPSQAVVAYGASGAFVHPATGYQIARAMRLAKPTAAAIVEGLASGTPGRAATRAYETIWPRSARRAWELYTFGMEVLCGFDAEQTRAFFRAFFDLPPQRWGPYMDGTASVTEIMITMARVFASASGATRRRLVRAARGDTADPLWRALMPGGVR